jgi:hypothetical protein
MPRKAKKKDREKAREKELKKLAKKCCHPGLRSCQNCPLKGR